MEALALGPAAYELSPLELLELAGCLYSRGDLDESERLDELASDLAEIKALPERERTC